MKETRSSRVMYTLFFRTNVKPKFVCGICDEISKRLCILTLVLEKLQKGLYKVGGFHVYLVIYCVFRCNIQVMLHVADICIDHVTMLCF